MISKWTIMSRTCRSVIYCISVSKGNLMYIKIIFERTPKQEESQSLIHLTEKPN